MKLPMMTTTKPTNIAGSVIIVMMGFGLLSALLARLRCQNAETLQSFDIQMRCILAGICSPPALLSGQGFGHVTPPLIRPAMPASDNS